MLGIRYKEYWRDRFRHLPFVALIACVPLATWVNALAIAAQFSELCRPFLQYTLFRAACAIGSWFFYAGCLGGGIVKLIEWHDERLEKNIFTEDDRRRIDTAFDMAYDYLPVETTGEETDTRDKLRIERYECEWNEMRLNKGFKPIGTTITAGALRRRREEVERILFEKYFPQQEIGCAEVDPSNGTSVHTALLLRKALALLPQDDRLPERLEYLRSRMKLTRP